LYKEFAFVVAPPGGLTRTSLITTCACIANDSTNKIVNSMYFTIRALCIKEVNILQKYKCFVGFHPVILDSLSLNFEMATQVYNYLTINIAE
jgi:hypothetical protein